jgi:hypothetical protein
MSGQAMSYIVGNSAAGGWSIYHDVRGYHVVDASGEKLCTINPRLEPRRQLAIAEFVIAAREGLLEFFQASDSEPEIEEAARRVRVAIAQLEGK